MKKNLSFILCIVLLINFILPLSQSYAYGAEKDCNLIVVENEQEDIGSKAFRENNIKPLSIQSKIAKKAIKVILENHKKGVKLIEDLGYIKEARAFDKYFSKYIAPELRRLLKWADVPSQAVADAIFRGLVNAGISRSSAIKAAHAVKTGLSWII